MPEFKYLIMMLEKFFCLDRNYLVYNLVRRNLMIKYRHSMLGIVWTLVIPAVSAVIYYFIFSHVMRVKMDHYLFFVITGIIPWGVFTHCLQAGLESIAGNQNLINKVPLPIQSLPLAESIYGFINLVMAFPVILIVALIQGVPVTAAWLFLLVLWGLFFLICYCLGLILGLLFVYFKDLRHILSLLLQLWFYATPVLYSESMVPPEYNWVLGLNPVGQIFTAFRTVLMTGGLPDTNAMAGIMMWALVAFAVAFGLWKSLRYKIAEDL